MDTKKERKVMLMLVSLMLIFGTAACGKQTDSSTANESETEQSVSQTEETEGFDMERIRKSIIIKGQPFEIPIALSDLGEEWTWKENENSWVGSNGNGLVDLYYNDEEWFVFTVENYFEGSEDEGIIYNLSIHTEDCSIDGLVPFVSTKQDVIEKYGEPTEIYKSKTDDGYPHHYTYGTPDDDAAPPAKQQTLTAGIDENDIVTGITITYYVDLEK